jgi:hypothetical protein
MHAVTWIDHREFKLHEKDHMLEPGMVACACNPSAKKAQAGGSQVQGQLRLCNETCVKKKTHSHNVLEMTK